MAQDLKYAVRVLLSKPAFAAVAALTLALGIGATTAIFSVVHAVLLRPLPYADPDRLTMVWMKNGRLNIAEDWHSYPNYSDYRDQNRTFDDIAAFYVTSVNLTGNSEPERVIAAFVSASLFPTLGVDLAMGRGFTPQEEEDQSRFVVSHGLWQRRYGGTPDILGQTIPVNGTNRSVVGVTAAGFSFPRKETAIWMPLPLSPRAKCLTSHETAMVLANHSSMTATSPYKRIAK